MFRISLPLFLPLLAFAQLTPNSVTVTATRSASARVDTVRLGVSIDASLDASLEDVVAGATAAGISPTNFTGLYYYSYPTNNPLPVTWNFATTAPLSGLKARIGLLTALQNSLGKDKKFALSFTVDGSEASAQAPGCAMADLIGDARAQAAKIASAAGMSVGAVQAVSGAVSGGSTTSYGIGGVSSVITPACSLTVKFALGGF